MLLHKPVCNKTGFSITRSKKFNDFMEPGAVDQVLDLSLCAFVFTGYVLFAFVLPEGLSKCKHRETRKRDNYGYSH
jgi:hypothetical protein